MSSIIEELRRKRHVVFLWTAFYFTWLIGSDVFLKG